MGLTIDDSIVKQIDEAMAAWLREETARFETKRVIDNHVDYMLKDITFDHATHEGLEIAIAAFNGTRRLIQSDTFWHSTYLLLRVPMNSTHRKLLRRPPTTMEALVADMISEPPSIYIISPAIYNTGAVWEQYHSPLPFTLIEQEPQVHQWYQEIRGGVEIERNWEYGRDVCIQFWNGAY